MSLHGGRPSSHRPEWLIFGTTGRVCSAQPNRSYGAAMRRIAGGFVHLPGHVQFLWAVAGLQGTAMLAEILSR